MIIQICVGSSCHLKGTEELVSMFQNALKENNLEAEKLLPDAFAPVSVTVKALPLL